MKILRYKNIDIPNKYITIIETDDGWYTIPKLGKDRENIFFSIVEIELFLNTKLELIDG